MHAVIYSRRCGWHVILSETGVSIESRLKPIVIGKSCVPYVPEWDEATGQQEADALAIGLYNIATNAPETCHNL